MCRCGISVSAAEKKSKEEKTQRRSLFCFLFCTSISSPKYSTVEPTRHGTYSSTGNVSFRHRVIQHGCWRNHSVINKIPVPSILPYHVRTIDYNYFEQIPLTVTGTRYDTYQLAIHDVRVHSPSREANEMRAWSERKQHSARAWAWTWARAQRGEGLTVSYQTISMTTFIQCASSATVLQYLCSSLVIAKWVSYVFDSTIFPKGSWGTNCEFLHAKYDRVFALNDSGKNCRYYNCGLIRLKTTAQVMQ